MASWLAMDWLKVATASGPVFINPATVEQVSRRPDGGFQFDFVSGEAIGGFVSARLIEDETTVFHDLKAEAEG